MGDISGRRERFDLIEGKLMDHTGTAQRPAAGLDVAVFDDGRLVMTKACHGLSEARAIMRATGRNGYRCLIVSPSMRETLAAPA